MIARYFRYQDGVAPNVAALSAVLLGYPLGIFLLIQPWWTGKAIGFVLVTLTLIWSAYFIHEFAHQAIFKTATANARWGTLMSWINGSCYAKFDALRRKHMRHHVERADVITFDVQAFLRVHPLLRKTIVTLEWLYIPAVEFLMHGVVMALPFVNPLKAHVSRTRIAAIFVLRTAAFAVLGWFSPSALVLYGMAYLVFVTVLRFADCFQHTYDAYPILDDAPIPADKVRDRAYEQGNTYSNIVGIDNRYLNMLWLNFGFHNAHHERPAMPWHQLPAFHRKLFGEAHGQVIPVRHLLKSFHVNRVKRVMASDYGEVLPADANGRADGFLGAVGVSFLTSV
ncbi:MAG: fatty acid desaturase [Pseudomonadota bacterium]